MSPAPPAALTVACLVFPGVTALDLVGPLQVFDGLARVVPGTKVVTVGATRGPVDTDGPVGLVATDLLQDVPCPDVVLVPGGAAGTLRAMADPVVTGWLREASASATRVVSVCTGSLLLGAVGLLRGHRATSHWAFVHLLPRFGAVPVEERWVEDGAVTTAAGVSAGLDVALHVCAGLVGEEAVATVAQMIEYDPRPPVPRSAWPEPVPGFAESLAAGVVARALPEGSELRVLLGGRT